MKESFWVDEIHDYHRNHDQKDLKTERGRRRDHHGNWSRIISTLRIRDRRRRAIEAIGETNTPYQARDWTFINPDPGDVDWTILVRGRGDP